MSQAVEVAQALPKPGDRDPDNPKRMWLLCTSGSACPWHPDGRWQKEQNSRKRAAAGFKRRCHGCAQRERWKDPDAHHPKFRDSNEDWLDGSIALLGQRSQEDTKNKVSPVACGICGNGEEETHKASTAHGRASHGICRDCTPWLILVLKREQYIIHSVERDKVYAKIKRVRKALDIDTSGSPRNSRMPFWSLAQEWADSKQRTSKASSWGHYLAHYKHLILCFEDKPITEIGDEEISRLEKYLSETPGTQGARSPVTVQKVKETLRRIFNYAVKQQWLEVNPLAGRVLVSRYHTLKSDRIVYVDEEERLHAAGVGEFACLKESLIYLADTGATDTRRDELSWPEVNFETGLIGCSGVSVQMTPRLARAMAELWERAGHPSAGRVWPPRPRVRDMFPRLCAAAGIERLYLKYFKRTAAIRMKEAGKDSWYIANVLGLSDPGFIRATLDVSSEQVQQEITSPHFKQFISDEFPTQSGNGENEKTKAEREEFESIVGDLLETLPVHRVRRPVIAAAYDQRRGTVEPLDPSTITHIVKRCYLKGTDVADAVALVDKKRRALTTFTEIHGS